MNDVPAGICRGVSRVYQAADSYVQALDHVDAEFRPGMMTALVGPSGSGKSSLLRILSGLDRPTYGSVEVSGVKLSDMRAAARRRARKRLVGYVFQRPSENLISYLDLRDHMTLAAQMRGGIPKDEIAEVLDLLGIAALAGHRPEELSGGEQQRLAFAQAAVGAPPILVADEPTAELDHASAAALLEVVGHIAKRGTAVIFATHDPVVAERADETIRLESGRRVG